MKEHQMFLRQRWQRLLMGLAGTLFDKDEQGDDLSKNELEYFLYCLEQIKAGQSPAVLEVLAEAKHTVLANSEIQAAVREVINSVDWADNPKDKAVAETINTIVKS